MRHLYRNDAIDWFAAESLEQAVAMARAHYELLGCDPKEFEADPALWQEPDEKLLTLRDGAEVVGRKTAAAWANEGPPGHFATTND